jgi:hypothetical protein
MCFDPFAEGQLIFIDHDHARRQDEKSSCGHCVRGLLCLTCNVALGYIERRYSMAQGTSVTFRWTVLDLNQRPFACQANAHSRLS